MERTDDLEELRVTSPCARRWDQLSGSGARRFCGDCRLVVHDLSSLPRAEARELLERRRRGQRVCVTYLSGADGVPLTGDELPPRVAARPGTARTRVAALTRRMREVVALLAAGAPLVAACGRAPEPTVPLAEHASARPGPVHEREPAPGAEQPDDAARAHAHSMPPCPTCGPRPPAMLRAMGY